MTVQMTKPEHADLYRRVAAMRDRQIEGADTFNDAVPNTVEMPRTDAEAFWYHLGQARALANAMSLLEGL